MALAVRRFHPLSFVGAGLAGGAAFLVLELVLLPPTKHVGVDWFLRLVAALMAGPFTLSAPSTQVGAVIAPALGMHASLSLAFGWIFCRMEDTLTFWQAIVGSVALGVGIYSFDFHVMTYLFPWFAMARGIATVIAHVAFGLTTVLTHKGLSGLRLPGRRAAAVP